MTALTAKEIVFSKEEPKDRSSVFGRHDSETFIMIGSTGGGDEFLARIVLAPGVNLQLFPKYGLVAMEVAHNGNTNLPACRSSEELLDHMFGDEATDLEHEDADGEPIKKPLPAGMVIAEYVDGAVPMKRELVLEAIQNLKKVAKEKAEEWKLSLGRNWEE
jgi:hypothetical protein